MKISQEKARKMHQLFVSADARAIDEFLLKYPDLAAGRQVLEVQKKIAAKMTEQEFVAWAGSGFALNRMPAVKLAPNEMQALSGGTMISSLSQSLANAQSNMSTVQTSIQTGINQTSGLESQIQAVEQQSQMVMTFYITYFDLGGDNLGGGNIA